MVDEERRCEADRGAHRANLTWSLPWHCTRIVSVTLTYMPLQLKLPLDQEASHNRTSGLKHDAHRLKVLYDDFWLWRQCRIQKRISPVCLLWCASPQGASIVRSGLSWKSQQGAHRLTNETPWAFDQKQHIQCTTVACFPPSFSLPMPTAMLGSGDTVPRNGALVPSRSPVSSARRRCGARCAARVTVFLPVDLRDTRAPGCIL